MSVVSDRVTTTLPLPEAPTNLLRSDGFSDAGFHRTGNRIGLVGLELPCSEIDQLYFLGADVEGTEELISLTEMLRIGIKTTREIARHRPRDYDKLMDIAARSEVIANELDEITVRPRLGEGLQ